MYHRGKYVSPDLITKTILKTGYGRLKVSQQSFGVKSTD